MRTFPGLFKFWSVTHKMGNTTVYTDIMKCMKRRKEEEQGIISPCFVTVCDEISLPMFLTPQLASILSSYVFIRTDYVFIWWAKMNLFYLRLSQIFCHRKIKVADTENCFQEWDRFCDKSDQLIQKS